MTAPHVAPYGTWKSPIDSNAIVTDAIRLSAIALDGNDIYWLEGRPTERGRSVLVRRTPDGETSDVTPPPFNVRTRVHEYGGGAFLVADGTIYFANFDDQRLYRHAPGTEPQALVPEHACRFAELVLDRTRDRLICVCEDHNPSNTEPINSLVAIDLATGAIAPLATGCDFYASPCLSPDGTRLAWIEWNHPAMPWDATRLQVAKIEDNGSLGPATCVAGSDERAAVCHPKWSPDGSLFFVSDRSNWWNLYRYTDGRTELLYELDAEFAYPHWVFGLSLYDFISAEQLLCTYTQNGKWHLARLNLLTRHLLRVDLPYTDLGSLHVANDRAVFIAGAPDMPTAAVLLNLGTGERSTLKQATSLVIDPGYLSVPEAIAFPTTDGETAHAWYYPPSNRDFTAPAGERPPLLVNSHGGPTAATAPTFSLKLQYWTSRGFAVLDVNYRGSTGYGRAYRERLQGRWGIVDLDDCAAGADSLVERGLADPNRLAIAGGSAGGYTTLAVLTFRDTFKAGCSRYGVSDLAILATETHKFESRYLDGLVGRYPEDKDIYTARSPLFHADRLSCPVIFFQGLEDKVVPPNQAELMVAALRDRGIPVAYIAFAGEQHGFRRAETIKRAIDGEFYFYSRIFGFEPADEIEPVEILNLG
ncbi:dipeptidyl aminopeptidase/acylaminoacyl-peptidase [Rubidibacter lacunae KORDI 51-2]|uniref:Dipeptidyl aminopeptidase/acylaminoacyl-peptidase n=1 Tax=Rubidibacter lacunae KORDI 51-2 TaxID=582515 RepID=U5DKV1_9CHRO|nr:S9 family peptidase [Rubidibacter lacunae]ERN42316.1 dipeptidyl aminopeptidase/acylaminoacyl-peptidase [Rubidibacter lacunae KORDI 51-2]